MGQIIMWQGNTPILLNADIFSYLLSSCHLLVELIKSDYRVQIFEKLSILLMLNLYLIQGHNEFTCSDSGSLIWMPRCIRVVHSNNFWAIFGSFSVFIFLPFFKNKLQNESKMN